MMQKGHQNLTSFCSQTFHATSQTEEGEREEQQQHMQLPPILVQVF